jgi:beta-glucosidase
MSDGTHALEALAASLSLERKVRLLTGADIWALHDEPGIGLRRVVTSDGPAGVRGERWDERFPSANVPSPTALAASWDLDRVERVGRLLAAEARRQGVDVLLAPTVNLHRTPYAGRHFECYSEDPYLSAAVGAAYVRGVQSGGVAATVKHFVANDSETDRFTVDVQVGERALREVYLQPFEAAVDAGVWAVMAAYNAVSGVTMTESPLLRRILKQEWGFDGVVVSDWYAGRSLAAAGPGLLDLVMPGPGGPWGPALVAAVRAGDVPESAVDEHVLRLLRLAARVGALAGVPAAVPPAEAAAGAAGAWPDAAIAAELRGAAAAGVVLAADPGSVLPLDPGTAGHVAVLGPGAAGLRAMGGGSATVFPPHTSNLVDGLSAALGGARVVHAAGVRVTERLPVAARELLTHPGAGTPGVDVRFFAADGRPLGRQHRLAASMFWWGPIDDGLTAADVARVELRTRLRVPGAPGPGRHVLGASGLGRLLLTLDGRVVLDTRTSLPPDTDLAGAVARPPQAGVEVELQGERDVEVTLTYEPARGVALGGTAPDVMSVQLNLERVVDEDAELGRAVTLAAAADTAVVVVGTTEEVESEGFDRENLRLPGRQDELVRAVAAVNPRTVVVVNAGAPVLLPWAGDVAAVLLAWFPGQEGGHALADVLLGRAEPGGRLPVTWPASEDGLPPVTPADGVLRYDEGIFVGHRAYDRDGRRPLFPFGHGLGYTTWEYEAAEAPATVAAGDDVPVTVRLRNAGPRPGREVVQVYASRPGSAVTRPVRWLAGFAAVEAGPGEAVTVEVRVPGRAFRHWDAAGGWATEPGAFRLETGRSSGDLRLSTELVLTEVI